MESRLRGIFLNAALMLGLSGLPGMVLNAAEKAETVRQEPIISPEIERRTVEEANIDTEDFEIGVFGGVMSVEDFGTNPVFGLRMAYHVTEDIFVELNYAMTDTSKTSYERLSGAALLLESDERELTYYNVSFGLNLLPGESFVGNKWAFTSGFYVSGGVGSTEFAGDDLFTWNIGGGYRFLATDWASIRIDVRDHVFDLDLLGEEQTNHNLEITGTVSVFF